MNPISRSAAIAYLAVTFLLGGVAGGAAGYRWGRLQWFRPPPPSGPMSQQIVQRLTAELSLTPDQQRQIEPIVQEGAAEMAKLHRETTERIHEAIRRGHEKLKPILTEAQQAKLAELDAAREKFSKQRWGGGPHPSSPPESKEPAKH